MHLIKAALMVGCIFTTVVSAEETERDQAIQLVKEAAKLVEAEGVDKTIEAINNPDGGFVKGEQYVFAYDTTGTMLAHPKNAKLVGKNMVDVPDVDGKLFRKDILAIALEKGTGWVDYKYKNPASNKVEAKTTYVMKAKTLVLCCGIYK